MHIHSIDSNNDENINRFSINRHKYRKKILIFYTKNSNSNILNDNNKNSIEIISDKIQNNKNK